MSTKLHDFAHQTILGAALTPRTSTSTVTGSAVDMITGDGRCVAVQQIGAVSGTSPTLIGKVQESADGSSGWADIAGTTFNTVTASDNLQAVSFDRTQRYVRYVGTITGTSPSFIVGVLISEQKKQV
jgi:hypothetical protein